MTAGSTAIGCGAERGCIPVATVADFHMIDEIWGYRKYDYFGYRVQPGDIVVDIGGNIGAFATYAAAVCRASRVLVFEPFPENFAMLTRNVEETGYRWSPASTRPSMGFVDSCRSMSILQTRVRTVLRLSRSNKILEDRSRCSAALLQTSSIGSISTGSTT